MVAARGRPTKLAVSTERYRLIQNEDDKGSVELYDIQADPHEWYNLAGAAAHRAALEQLQKLAGEHREKYWKYWDSLPATEPAPKAGKKKQ